VLSAIKLPVPDLPQAASFYTSHFGLVLDAKHNESEWALRYPGPGESTEIVLVKASADSPPFAEGRLDFGPAWLVLQVTDTSTLMTEIASAGGQEVMETQLLPEYGVQLAIAKDPFGNILELVSPLDR
jgi:predicted enzyme related to lactoylglutathione lyase